MTLAKDRTYGQNVITSMPIEVAGQQLVRRFSRQEFDQVCRILWNECLELMNGEVVIALRPDQTHIQQAIEIETLLRKHYAPIHAMGCLVSGASAWYFLDRPATSQWVDRQGKGSNCVRPDASICYVRYQE
ncbi:MAG TPA: hypothetical protein VFZ34_29700 [Blastocatellia bacterium]|nr:hypothetical protein [Blastocatellia bacterium]